jgi:Predicted transcriptional regulators
MPKYHRIKDLREDMDINQTQFAKKLGMSQTGYSKYETGENDIPTDILIKIADIHKTSTDYLLGRTDVKKPYARTKERN